MVTLDTALIAAPPIDLRPDLVRRCSVPADVEVLVLKLQNYRTWLAAMLRRLGRSAESAKRRGLLSASKDDMAERRSLHYASLRSAPVETTDDANAAMLRRLDRSAESAKRGLLSASKPYS